MVIFFLLVLAMLAGWGLDELTGAAAGARRAADAGARRRGGHLLRAVRLDARRRHARPRAAAGRRSTWPGASPTPPARIRWQPVERARRSRRSGSARCCSGCRWPAPGSLLDRASPARHPHAARRVLPAGAFVALAVAVLVADLFRANMGFNPAIPIDNAEQPATGRDPLPAVAAPEPLRRARLRRATSSRCSPTWRCATGSTTRAATTIRSSKRYDTLVAGDGRAARVLQHPDRRGDGHPESAARDEPAQRRRHHPGPRPTRPPAARPASSPTPGRDARVYRNRTRCRARSWWIASRSCDGADAALTRPRTTGASTPATWR